jgi:hypothetical protein
LFKILTFELDQNQISNVSFLQFKFIETVEGLVRQGIKKANEDLKKENEKKMYEEV